jgi:hypothetical protein
MELNSKFVKPSRKFRNLSMHGQSQNQPGVMFNTFRNYSKGDRNHKTSQNRRKLPPPPYGKTFGHGIIPLKQNFNYTADLNSLLNKSNDSGGTPDNMNLTSDIHKYVDSMY